MIKELLGLNKNKELKSWQGYRIDTKRVTAYVKDAYDSNIAVPIAAKTISNVKPLLQADYGGDGDCTLTSITTVLLYYLKYSKPVEKVYNIVEKYATKFLYNEKYGTIPIFIKAIIDRSSKEVGLNDNSFSKNFKNIGVTWDRIKKLIRDNRPVILSLSDDGREYYASHSITIVGYTEYKIEGNRIVRMLKVYDNWRENIGYVDFEKLGRACCINYF